MEGDGRGHRRGSRGAESSSRGLPLIGRATELSACLTELDEAVAGPARVLCLVGEAGIGKSRLLEELLEVADARGWRMLVGRAEMLERERQGAVVVDALRTAADSAPGSPLAAAYQRMVALAPVDPVASADAFVDAVAAAALGGPVVLAVENLEWSDETSLLGLRLLLRHRADAPMLLVLAARSASPLATMLDGWSAPVRSVPLGPLGPDDVTELARCALRLEPGPALVGELQGTGGNPLFVLELLAALKIEQRITCTTREAELVSQTLPEGFRQTVTRRLAQLPAATVRLLKIAAVLGSRFSPSSLGVVLGQPVAAFTEDLLRAVEAGILDDAGDQLSFRHDLAREAVYQGIPSAARVALHLDAATRLADAGAPPDVVLPHLLASARGHDARAVALLLASAERDRASAPGRAAVLYGQALTILEPSDPRRPRITAAMLNPLARSGRLADAERLARVTLLAPPDARSEFLAHEALWVVLLRRGRLAEYRRDVEEVARHAALVPAEQAMATARLANVMALTDGAASARALASAGAAQAAGAGHHGLEALHRSTATFVELADGHVEAALEAARASSAADSRHPDRVQNVQLYLACALAEADRLAEATIVAAEGRAFDEAIGDHSVLAVYHWLLGYLAYVTGDWATAAAEVESALDLRHEREIAEVGLPLGIAIAARLALHRSDLTQAAALVEEWHRLAPGRGPQVGDDLLLWSEALLHRRLGDVDRALESARSCWQAGEGRRYLLTWRLVAPDLVDLALVGGDRQLAEAICEAAVTGARRAPGVSTARATAAHCRGLLDRDGNLLAEAVAGWTAGGRPSSAAMAAWHGGAVLLEQGDRSEAEARLRDALEAYDSLGALAEAGDLANDLAVLGRNAPQRRPLTGWGALTPAEQDVVALVREGLTNRQIGERLFISRHTVDSHLRHVFQKVGVRSRTELASRASVQNHAIA